MDLIIWSILVTISLVLIVIGLTRPTESAQALIGFFFLFLLSFSIINGTLEYVTGTTTTTTYSYINDSISSTLEVEQNTHTNFSNHNIGFWFAVASAIGFAGVLYSLKKTKWEDE